MYNLTSSEKGEYPFDPANLLLGNFTVYIDKM